MQMQQVKTYASGMFKREARYQFIRDLKKMTKRGWYLFTRILMKEWVQVPGEHQGEWPRLAEAALEYVSR